jgi:hypothetical protein
MRLSHLMIIGLIFAAGCCDVCEPDHSPPAVPRGVHSVTGDLNVRLYWYPNRERDFEGYNVYRSYYPEGPYYVIASTPTAYYVDRHVANGETYFYAVTAYDVHHNESELSYEMVFDTPRPEGFNVVLWDYHIFPLDAGFNFSEEMVQPYDLMSTDIYFEVYPPSLVPYVNVGNPDTDIQDFGYIEDLDAIDYAPESGWSSLGYVEAIQGHGYIVWTWDNHFAKFRIDEIGDDYMRMDWAYQIDPGNPELIKHPELTEGSEYDIMEEVE